ncbi:AMP-binding protein [Vibrio sp. PP-XX7]
MEALCADMGRMVDRRALFATTINILPFEYDAHFGECRISSVHNLSIGPTDDLSITWCERGEAQGLELCLDANAALYSAETLALHLERVNQFFDCMVAYHEAPIAQYPLLLEIERNQVLHQFNMTQMDVPSSCCMQELIERQAALTPEAVAVVDELQSLTYQRLNTQANQIAHWLVALGVKPDRYVSIALERRCELVVALLAVLKAGGAYVPLDPGYPEERLQYILEDSAPDILITSEAIRQQLGALPTQLTVIDMDRDVHQWRTRSGDNIPTDALGLTSRNLAYMIYTSGSTGKPKESWLSIPI